MKTMSRFFLVLAGVAGFAVAVALVPMAGCSDDNSNQVFDMSPDFALSTQVTHVGVTGQTCCMVTRGAQLAMYLTNVMQGMVDSQGITHAATGELHLVTALGTDYKLGDNVPAFAYQFSPDGTYAMYGVKTPMSKVNYSLNFATVSYPNLPPPLVQTVIPDGIQDFSLAQQSFFSATGKYLIIGVLHGAVMNSPDLHIVDVRAATDVAQLGNGAFDYLEIPTPDDQLIYNNSTASMKPGTPSVVNLYQANLSVFANGNVNPSILDTSVTNATLFGDGFQLLYLKEDGTLWVRDIAQHFLVKVTDNVMAMSTGPLIHGPLVWTGKDLSLHVANQYQAEMITTPPNMVDSGSPFVFSADASRLYFFKNVQASNNYGDLYSVSVAPGQPRTINLIGTRISTQDFNFFQDRFLFIRGVDDQGVAGELVSASLDGSNPIVLGENVQVGGLRQSQPNPVTPPGQKDKFGPVDLSPSLPHPINAVLTDAKRQIDPSSSFGSAYVPVNDSSPIVGALSFGFSINTRLGLIDPAVHAGMFRFSDDGYVLAYAGGAQWNSSVTNFVGSLKLQPTITDTNPIQPQLDGVAEMGPISQRSMFVSAPANAKPGIYFVKF
jgi:hypothetical protein